jgi:hypothetical protein
VGIFIRTATTPRGPPVWQAVRRDAQGRTKPLNGGSAASQDGASDHPTLFRYWPDLPLNRPVPAFHFTLVRMHPRFGLQYQARTKPSVPSTTHAVPLLLAIIGCHIPGVGFAGCCAMPMEVPAIAIPAAMITACRFVTSSSYLIGKSYVTRECCILINASKKKSGGGRKRPAPFSLAGSQTRPL